MAGFTTRYLSSIRCNSLFAYTLFDSDKGHDSFLLDVPEFLKTLSQFLDSTYNEINNEKRI